MATILNNPITYYRSEEAAAKIAATNQAGDDEAEYRVEPFATGFCIAVYVDGERVIRL